MDNVWEQCFQALDTLWVINNSEALLSRKIKKSRPALLKASSSCLTNQRFTSTQLQQGFCRLLQVPSCWPSPTTVGDNGKNRGWLHIVNIYLFPNRTTFSGTKLLVHVPSYEPPVQTLHKHHLPYPFPFSHLFIQREIGASWVLTTFAWEADMVQGPSVHIMPARYTRRKGSEIETWITGITTKTSRNWKKDENDFSYS